MKMDFAVGTGRNEKIWEIADIARTAEESGFSYLTFLDEQNLSRDVYIMMTIAALNTRRIKIGQGVPVPVTRHPSVTANATSTVNELSGGRVVLGIGTGGGAMWTMGMKTRSLGELREIVQFVKKYTNGEKATFQGAEMHSEWIKQPLKIYLSGGGPNMLKMAGEIADGVMLSSNFGIDPVATKWKLEQIEKGLEKAGRDMSQLDLWVRGMIFVTGSKVTDLKEVAGYAVNSARSTITRLQQKGPEIEDLRRRLQKAYPGLIEDCQKVSDAWAAYDHERTDTKSAQLVSKRIMDAYHLAGTPDEICAKINKVGELGIKTIATTLYTAIDKKGVMREIGDKVMPYFRN